MEVQLAMLAAGVSRGLWGVGDGYFSSAIRVPRVFIGMVEAVTEGPEANCM